MIKKVIFFLLASPTLFLLVNRYPFLLITAVLVSVFLGAIFFLYKKQITPYHLSLLGILLILYACLLISYFFSGQTFSNILQYNFLRYDSNFFFCYVMFFVLAVPFFDYRVVSDIYYKMLFSVFSLFALAGLAEFFMGFNILLIGTDGTVAGRMFVALNFSHNATGSVYAILCLFVLVFFK